LIKLQRGLESGTGDAAQTKAMQEAENIEALESYLMSKFEGGQTIDDILTEIRTQKEGLETAAQTTERIAATTEEAIPTATPQETGRSITETISEAKKPVRKIEKEYWEKVP